MSDALSAIEIEDVLSSIRRLVSEDLRPAAAAQATPAATEPRLLLTPALRVVPQQPEDSWDEEEDWIEEPMVAQLSPSGWSLPEAEPEPADLDAPSSLPIQPASVRIPSAATEAPEPADPAPLPPHRFTLTQAARVVPAESETTPDPWDQPVDTIETRPPEPEVAPRAATAAEQIWADRAAAEAIAGIEAVEALDDATSEELEEPLETLSESDPAFQAEDAALGEGDAPEATYDEVLLRELVRDILREELSGALGEKITRNVRKLVRAEIAQALATRDLE